VLLPQSRARARAPDPVRAQVVTTTASRTKITDPNRAHKVVVRYHLSFDPLVRAQIFRTVPHPRHPPARYSCFTLSPVPVAFLLSMDLPCRMDSSCLSSIYGFAV